jgi:hypothetical protein
MGRNEIENSILLITKFKQYEKVCHKTTPDKPMIVIGFVITGIDDDGKVSQHTVSCAHGDGGTQYFFPGELEKYDPVGISNKEEEV